MGLRSHPEKTERRVLVIIIDIVVEGEGELCVDR
jgi:hypothetical protein